MQHLQKKFPEFLLTWHRKNTRDLPWKVDNDPYRTWISEIILQQTRVEQGLPYFVRFIDQFPDLKSLAKAPEDHILQVWQGLGYYSRARNLHHTAKQIYFEMDGKFPDNYKALLQLKGIGPYTAAAISSFAFGEVKAVVDGNVIRVLSRVFGIATPFDTTAGKKIFASLAEQLIYKKNPATYNQAIMDFGAIQCTPKNPNCKICPMKDFCIAHQKSIVSELPVKSKKIQKKHRYFNFYNIIDTENQTLIEKRTEKDIWQGLYQFPQTELDQRSFETLEAKTVPGLLLPYLINPKIKNTRHLSQTLTHQKIHAKFITVAVDAIAKGFPENFFLVDYENLCNFAFPKIIDWFIAEN